MTALSELVCAAGLWIFLALFILAIYYRLDKWLEIRVTNKRTRQIGEDIKKRRGNT